MSQLGFELRSPFEQAISPFLEMGAYEALWAEDKASFRTISSKFRGEEAPLPSELVERPVAIDAANMALSKIRASNISSFGVRIYRDGEYPESLRVARYAPELIYYQGLWDLLYSKSAVAIVGTRTPSEQGALRTKHLVRRLVDDGATIVSGLAKGIDTAAHTACIEAGGQTIGVLGTPITKAYPKQNLDLQQELAANHLLVSQVPINRYDMQVNPVHNRHFFPERNVMMSALTRATVIVEAGETSGTLVQAKAAIEQGRMLFILDNCFRNDKLSWPKKFEEMGAIRVKDYDDIRYKLFPKKIVKN
ncbi:MAG: DNA-processing protein DprA [Pseudomonadota bacterium]